jgi:RNA polymerase sigma-70 factor (ECF subfamily)
MQEFKPSAIPLDEPSLIRKVQSNNKYFDQLILQYQDVVYRYSLTCTGKTSDAEDLTQEVFLKLFENIQKIEPEKPLIHWLLKITKNANINFLTKKRNEKKALRSHIQEKANTKEETKSYELNAALGTLEEKEHAIISMRYFQDLSCEAIGKIFDMTPNAVSIQLYRTKNKLKEILQEQNKNG